MTACVALIGSSFAPPAVAAGPAAPTVVKGSGETAFGLFTAGPEGAEWELPSGARLFLTPNSAARVFARAQSLDLGGGKTPTWSLALTKGRVDIEVPAKPRGAVLVSVERASAVVTDGRVSVVAALSETVVVNQAGSVRTYIDQRWATVQSGHLSRIDPRHPAGSVESLLPPPLVTRGRSMWLTTNDPITLGEFAWQAVPGAARYELELRTGAKVVRALSVREESVTALATVSAGQYELFARSIDEHGIAGAWSAPKPLRVLGVELPPGAYVEDGGVFLNHGQKVTFSHTTGLEMTYVGAGRYIPATDPIGLYRNKRTIVSFRLPGSAEDTVVRLEPRDVYAEVVVGPKRATWPKDRLDVSVRLLTRAGGPVPDFITVVPKVLVGVEPLEVSWQRHGNELRTSIAPQASRGPWVVRVDVSDQFGIPLGRDFVEVAENKVLAASNALGARAPSARR